MNFSPAVIATEALANVAEPEFSVLMPCLNERSTVGTCIRKAQAFLESENISGEVVVADNGSTDGSQFVANRSGARVISVVERGYGTALSAGISAARGRYVIMGDADDSYDFSELHGFVYQLRAGAQLVMGNRFAGGIAEGAMPWHHKYIGNPVLSLIGRVLFRSSVRDFHCGLRGFERAAIQKLDLRCTGMEFASEMVAKAEMNGLKVSEVPTKLSKDGRDRPSHLRSFRDGWRHLRFLLLHSPRWLFLYPGVLLIIFGALLQTALSMGPLSLGVLALDIHTMLYSAAMMILGLQMSVFWIFTRLIGWRDGFLPAPKRAVRWLFERSLEFGLVAGTLLLLCGLLIGIRASFDWAFHGFGALNPTDVMRAVIPSVTLMLSGAEIAFASCVLSVIKLGAAVPSGAGR